MIIKEGQVFNLMDTNGRRNDVSNALQGYLLILDEIQNDRNMLWSNLPNSLAQYTFYKEAISLSPDVFTTHTPYDNLQQKLLENTRLKEAIDNDNIQWIKNHQREYAECLELFDKGIEDRARHYTSNLVKLGLCDANRQISEMGYLLLNSHRVSKDLLEETLPIDEINTIYLRQLLKLRIYNYDKTRYYSPFKMALLILLLNNRVDENLFFEMVQGISPYQSISNLEQYVKNYREGDVVRNETVIIPNTVSSNRKIDKEVFYQHFKNQKSQSAIHVYWEFYSRLYMFNDSRNQNDLNSLLEYFTANRTMLNKAFGYGSNCFKYKSNGNNIVSEFVRNNPEFCRQDLNKALYRRFVLSKKMDQIREYSDTTKRILKVTGIISFDHGYVQFAYSELSKRLFDEEDIIGDVLVSVLGDSKTEYSNYEEHVNSYFCTNRSTSEILEYDENKVGTIINDIQVSFGKGSVTDIAEYIRDKRSREFSEFINTNYPKDKVQRILGLFADRNNDRTIKEEVGTDASIPTIYEYIVGIAWYYFSNKTINLLNSFNLTLSANFEPLVHAGGGTGDIVIYDPKQVVMLEVTLMNTSSQKRGEWEPVLRHSINLKVDEESNNTGRRVTTFFIADEFDNNTINIWKAVAAVPLESSTVRGVYTDNVVIMPIKTAELSDLVDIPTQYQAVIDAAHDNLSVERENFNFTWREDIIKSFVS